MVGNIFKVFSACARVFAHKLSELHHTTNGSATAILNFVFSYTIIHNKDNQTVDNQTMKQQGCKERRPK
jgi:hypothetical protein